MTSYLRWGLAACLAMIAACHTVPVHVTGTAGADQSAVRQEFVEAMGRVRLHVPEPPDSPALEAYPIHDYLTAARLRRDLEREPDAAIDAKIDTFLQARVGQPVTRDLRREWLASLADRQRWDWFLPRVGDVTDPLLSCDRLEGRLATGATAGLAADALARWLLPLEQPAACDRVFAWLRLQDALTPAQAERRTRAALAIGNVRLALEFVTDVPPAQAAPLLQWARLLAAPKSTLNTLASDATIPIEAQALEAGFNRLSLSDSTAAATLLPLLLGRADMTPALQAQLQRAAALGLAYDHEPAALAAFADLPTAAIDDQVREWRVRAALWSGNYPQALDWIEQLPPSLATQPRWRYWHARAVAAIDGADMAAPLFADISGMRDYYGYLAADRLRRQYDLNARPSPDDTATQNTLATEPGVLRARELFACGMADEAGVEWAVALSDSAPAVEVQAAHLASHWGWYAQSIATLARADEWDDVRLRYPRPYPAATAAASKLTQLPADWLLALMRQESLFRADAVSRADARGLMQLQIATAVAVAQRWQLPLPSPDALFDPGVAVVLGAAHLRELLDQYGKQLGLALAAYNAGSTPVARWLPTGSMDADIWVENIPYNETRGYVEHTLEHIVAYAWTRAAPPPQLTTLLPPVAKAATAP